MDEIINKSLLVSGVEDKDGKISLMEQTGGQQYPTKYSFFKQTQAGEPSKAFTQYQEMGVSVGKVYTIAVKETRGVNKMSGKPVTYRNIAYFVTGDTQTPNQTENPATVNVEPHTTSYRPTKEAMGQRKEMLAVMEKKADNINQFQAKRDNSMQHLAICRDATLLTIAELNGILTPDPEEMKKKLKEWNTFLKNNIYDVPFV